ncbi:hypothetical protein [Cohnella lupini]|uniref:Uncharacterized protein n=1 Tax=Cohnella lupini TaxID=1294267 RepID=A0A3D9I7D2_9BACL|nr:hypothetical protein [Cohnella lupini]RED57545.1 hypothetical protein DFP95_11017 [Cohnella lupini]
MYEEMYSLALLKPEEVEEIREMEQRLSEKIGQPISLIAYRTDIASGKPG